jgi:hypothetical protein
MRNSVNEKPPFYSYSSSLKFDQENGRREMRKCVLLTIGDRIVYLIFGSVCASFQSISLSQIQIMNSKVGRKANFSRED